MRSRGLGFSMIELITVLIVLAILAALALPKLNTVGDFRATAFRDSVAGGLRFAQKTATSHRRVVCATLTPVKLTLTIASNGGIGTACDTPLALPNGAASVDSTDTAGVTLAGMPAALFFQPDGRITTDAAGAVNAAAIAASVNGQPIALEGSTGYVK